MNKEDKILLTFWIASPIIIMILLTIGYYIQNIDIVYFAVLYFFFWLITLFGSMIIDIWKKPLEGR